jgi:DNA polymerase (family 10)
MPMDKDKVAEILVEIGTLLELKGENPFKTRAYSNGARTIQSLEEPLEKLVGLAKSRVLARRWSRRSRNSSRPAG